MNIQKFQSDVSLQPTESSTSTEGLANTSENNAPKLIDLSSTIQNKSLPIHKHANMSIGLGEAMGRIRVFDLAQVYVDEKAKVAIDNAYITPLFLIEAFARQYKKSLLRTVTRGNDKGCFILDRAASSYVHKLSDGGELSVHAETVEVDGKPTRRLTLTCPDQITKGGVQ